MKKDRITFFTLIIFIILTSGFGFLFLNNSTALALNLQNSSGQLDTAGRGAGYIDTTSNTYQPIEFIIGQIIKIVLSFLGVLFLILTIYGGFKWMTAHGNEEQLTKAKKLIVEATTGLIIVLASYIITFYVIAKLISAVFDKNI
jgi:hypothetical protein